MFTRMQKTNIEILLIAYSSYLLFEQLLQMELLTVNTRYNVAAITA